MQSGGVKAIQEGRPQEDSSAGENPSAEDSSADTGSDEFAPQKSQPFDLGLREEAGVRLLLLDVKVRDEDGRPVRGLTMDDFEVTIGGRPWPLAAVDDFCNCAPGAPGDPGQSAAASPAQSGEPLPQHFVMYLDFSELRQSGRMAALGLAHRWVEYVMQPGDRVMVAGYSTAAGLVEITPFTTDKDVLLHALQAASTDKSLAEPFADRFFERLAACAQCMGSDPERYTVCCAGYAAQDASQGGRALEALDLFISSLAGIPGRKQIILFNQNNQISPANPYMDNVPARISVKFKFHNSWKVQNHATRVARVAATAVANRTTINVASMSPDFDVKNLGSNLADYTGGIADGYRLDAGEVLQRAGRECCMYRLSVQVPDDPPGRTLPTKVYVQGRLLDFSYRVRFYSPQERWFRSAQYALLTTSRSPDAEVQIAVLPRARRDKRWSVDVQVAFALNDLQMVPRVADRRGRWRVGALFNREDGRGAWEMLTLAQVKLNGADPTTLQALHSRRIDDLKPGDYRLRAFVEDAELNRFWSREVSLTLPAAGKKDDHETWLSTPIPSQWIDKRLELDLAPVTKKKPVTSVVGAPAAGFVPLSSDHVAVGAMVKYQTLVCPGPEQDAPPPTVSILLKDGQPLVRLPAAVLEDAGECVVLTDTVDTAMLGPGSYVYRLKLNRGEQGEPLLREVALTVRTDPWF